MQSAGKLEFTQGELTLLAVEVCPYDVPFEGQKWREDITTRVECHV